MSWLTRTQIRLSGSESLLAKVEPSAEVTNVGDSSLLVERDGDKEEEREGAIPIDPCHPGSYSDCAEVLSVCDDANSAESFTLRRAICQAQQTLLSELYEGSQPLTRSRLLEVLRRNREALLSARDCLNARAECLVPNHIPAKKKIGKKTRVGRRNVLLSSSRAPSGTGLAMVLPAPIEVETEADLYFANDYLSEQFEEERQAEDVLGLERSLRWGGERAEELYGISRLEADSYERNNYFSSPDMQANYYEFD